MDAISIHTTERLGTLLLPRLVIGVLTGVLVLGACGGEGDEPKDASPSSESTSATDPATGPGEVDEPLDTEVPDLCDLFTADDFESVTGEPAGPPETQAPLGAIRGSCSVGAEAGFPMVMVAAYDEADREATLAMVDAEPVDDLGTEAYWDETMAWPSLSRARTGTCRSWLSTVAPTGRRRSRSRSWCSTGCDVAAPGRVLRP